MPAESSNRRRWTVVVVVLAAAVAGCPGNGSPGGPPPPPRPYAGISLRVVCGDAAVAAAIRPQALGWAIRNGVTLTVEAANPTLDTAADVVIIPPDQVGWWADRSDAREVPRSIQADDQPARWQRILAAYRDRLTAWGPSCRAVPLAGDAYVLVYRADKFADPTHQAGYRNRFGRKLEPPSTWENYAEIAAYFASAAKKPSLPPVSAEPTILLREFNALAACYDRPALTESTIRTRGEGFDTRAAIGRALSFHHDAQSGAPRLTAPAFVAAARWLDGVKSYRMAPDPTIDTTSALDTGTAVLAVLTLSELGRLPKDKDDTLSTRFGIAPLPGTRIYYDADGSEQTPPDRMRGANFIPYYGSGGWVGIVREKCSQPQAAFELLGTLAGPDPGAERLSDPALGFGPYRTDQLEPQREAVWLRYGLDTVRSKMLIETLRQFAAVTLANPAFASRGPDQAELMAVLASEVRAAATGKTAPADAMKQANEAWRKLDASRPPGTAAAWRRKSAGLE